MTLQEISDKLEINELLARYCHALDQKNWEAFKAVFVEDAVLDFTAFNGPKSSPAELENYFKPILDSLASSQHTVSTVMIELTGDTAKVRSAAIVPMTTKSQDGKETTFMSGLWYEDSLLRTAKGWKISERIQVRSWAASLV